MVFHLIHWATKKDGVANPTFPNETTNLAIQNIRVQVYMVKASRFPP